MLSTLMKTYKQLHSVDKYVGTINSILLVFLIYNQL